VKSFLRDFNEQFAKIRNLEADAAWNASVKITPENQQDLEEVQQIK
jgi:hypothetical protein